MGRNTAGDKADGEPATTAELIEARVRELRALVNAGPRAVADEFDALEQQHAARAAAVRAPRVERATRPQIMESDPSSDPQTRTTLAAEAPMSVAPLDVTQIVEHEDLPAYDAGTLRFRTVKPTPAHAEPPVHLLDPEHDGTHGTLADAVGAELSVVDSATGVPMSAPALSQVPPLPDLPTIPGPSADHALHAVVTAAAMPTIDVDQAIADIAGRVQERIDAGLAQTQDLIRSSSELAQSAAEGSLDGVIELVARSEALHRGLQDELSMLRREATQMDPAPRIAALNGTVADLQSNVDALIRGQAELVRALLDRLDAGTRRTDQRLDVAMAELSGSVGGALETLQRRAIADGSALRTGLEQVTSELPRLVVPGIAETVRNAQQRTEIRIEELQSRLSSSIAGEHAMLEERFTELTTDLDERFTELTSDLDEREEQQYTDLTAAVDALRSELTTQLTGAIQEITATLQRDIAALHGSVARELDFNRLQHVRDTELLIDAMDAGWRSVATRVSDTDSELARLRGTIDHWFHHLSDDAADIDDDIDRHPS